MSERKQRIYNGLCKKESGYRQVLVSDAMQLRPVVFKADRGYIDKRCTVQIEPVQGDYLFKVSWDKDVEEDSIQQWNGNSWEPVSFNNYSELWKALTVALPWTTEFLARAEQSESYMPWEGYTLSEKGKAHKARQFLKAWHIRDFKIDDFVQSPKEGLSYDAVKIKEEVLEHIPHCETIEVHDMQSIRKDHWFMDIGHRIVKVAIDFDTEASKALKDIIPKNVKRLAHVQEGAYEHEGIYHGMRVAVYELE